MDLRDDSLVQQPSPNNKVTFLEAVLNSTKQYKGMKIVDVNSDGRITFTLYSSDPKYASQVHTMHLSELFWYELREIYEEPE